MYNIEKELQHAIDCHSKTLISRYIELLLDYCSRFYDRQFITRNEVNKAILNKMDIALDDYIQSGQLKTVYYPLQNTAQIYFIYLPVISAIY